MLSRIIKSRNAIIINQARFFGPKAKAATKSATATKTKKETAVKKEPAKKKVAASKAPAAKAPTTPPKAKPIPVYQGPE